MLPSASVHITSSTTAPLTLWPLPPGCVSNPPPQRAEPYYPWSYYLSNGETPTTPSPLPQWSPNSRSHITALSAPLPYKSFPYTSTLPPYYPALSTPRPTAHRWDLTVLHYHEIMLIHPYPFLAVITLLFS